MRVAVRVDASTWIGSGHVMRCLTLADALRANGAHVRIVCRQHQGHLAGLIRERGYAVDLLDPPPSSPLPGSGSEAWLGVPQQQDAAETVAVLGDGVDLMIVDHYGIDREGETHLRAACRALMAIDDMANRPHDCDVLLDQNLVAAMDRRYAGLTPPSCRQLIGPRYALVRPEFARARPASLARRPAPRLDHVLIFMGGSDPDDDTSAALEGVYLAASSVRRIDVVVGQGYRGKERIAAMCAAHPGSRLHVQTPHMAALMADADLAITAGGSVSWEKCVLGLPSLVAVQAENQRPIAEALATAGAQVTLGPSAGLAAEDYARALSDLPCSDLGRMSAAAAAICDGEGAARVLASLPQL